MRRPLAAARAPRPNLPLCVVLVAPLAILHNLCRSSRLHPAARGARRRPHPRRPPRRLRCTASGRPGPRGPERRGGCHRFQPAVQQVGAERKMVGESKKLLLKVTHCFGHCCTCAHHHSLAACRSLHTHPAASSWACCATRWRARAQSRSCATRSRRARGALLQVSVLAGSMPSASAAACGASARSMLLLEHVPSKQRSRLADCCGCTSGPPPPCCCFSGMYCLPSVSPRFLHLCQAARLPPRRCLPMMTAPHFRDGISPSCMSCLPVLPALQHVCHRGGADHRPRTEQADAAAAGGVARAD